mgnify:CR=1 FL=1
MIFTRVGIPSTVHKQIEKYTIGYLIDDLGSRIKNKQNSLVRAINQPVTVESTFLIASVINTIDNSTHQKQAFTMMLSS